MLSVCVSSYCLDVGFIMNIIKKECQTLASFEHWVDYLFCLYAKQAAIIFLQGSLGAGKTAFARRWLYCAGVRGRVKSPSFSLLETYDNTTLGVMHHLDLYRLASPEEIWTLGLDHYMGDRMLIEWPEHGASQVFSPSLVIEIKISGDVRLCSCQVHI